MAFHSIQEAEQRLQNPQPLTEQEVIDLIPWMQMLGAGSHARLQAHLGIGNVRAIQALNETSGKIEGLAAFFLALYLNTVSASCVFAANCSTFD